MRDYSEVKKIYCIYIYAGKGISMPKMKSNKSAVKRFKLTANGRVKRGKAFASHLLKQKSTKRKRNYRKPGFLTPADEKRVKDMIL
jgi:large subunit ribosomal protein L35